ncbi:P-loop containing nucleoside triphosphate hydrolase protein [Mycena belliarum]|uniref:P-loop containing nucleoside triphosphate hydrolase protein n=1 Tax=Mycena belliarum TaxID=1033014 RepID=A0AAD6TQL1_9AGAR|nr:P-loop containing nucleoside triphosphate hydrolase protein [Mycena belliae]
MPLHSLLDQIRGRTTPRLRPEQPPPKAPGHVASSLGLSSIGSTFSQLSQSYIGSSIKLLLLGSLIETGRRAFCWLIDRFGVRYSTTVRFTQGDPSYEWIVLFLTQENVWRRSREFVVSASNSRRKWAVRASSDATVKANAEYVPTYKTPQLFRWRGYWVEVKRSGNVGGGDVDVGPYPYPGPYGGEAGSIYITVYTLDMNVLSDLVEDARLRYLEVNRPNVVIHLSDSQNHYGPGQTWTTVKHKIRRPLSSIILPPGVIDTLVQDAQEFLNTENWYIEAGIPHRRGYLLHGPPGTGKTSTIYALAGALNLEIYSLSLASHAVDDSFLQRAASSIPKHGLLLIEDIDCAFASRDDDIYPNHGIPHLPGAHIPAPRSKVTLSGLLNVIDGVGSEEGKLFFATTNHIDRLDAALLRPGRIDRKVAYGLTTPAQAHALFLRFFPVARFPVFADPEKATGVDALAAAFAAGVPEELFSTAELQGFLQGYKTRPVEAAHGVSAWVEAELAERRERERRKEERRRRTPMVGVGLDGLPLPEGNKNV